jgi:hypothetical protein
MADRPEPEIPQAPAEGQTALGHTSAEALSTSETSAPMLDVHAPHQSIHTWRDFFIHIAVISIGLLIAIGLEQTVEYLHHRHQVADLREALRIERGQNHLRLADQTTEFRMRVPILQTNLAVLHYLRLHPGAAERELPPDLSHLTPVQIEEQIRLTRILLNRLYRYGSDLRNLSISNPDFSAVPTNEEIGSLVHESAEERNELEESAQLEKGRCAKPPFAMCDARSYYPDL